MVKTLNFLQKCVVLRSPAKKMSGALRVNSTKDVDDNVSYHKIKMMCYDTENKYGTSDETKYRFNFISEQCKKQIHPKSKSKLDKNKHKIYSLTDNHIRKG